MQDFPNNGARARDFFMDGRSPCNGGAGVCPEGDNQQGTSAFSNDIAGVSGSEEDGLTLVRYTRPLVPDDVGATVDKTISTSGETFIVWALGPMNAQTGIPGFHTIGYPTQDVSLEFGRSVVDNCVPLVEIEEDVPPPPFHRPFVGDDETWINAHIGPAGGPRGYEAIRDGIESFGGLAWYLNGKLIPELVLRRGTTYRFRVNGGDPHPFYLTESPSGGYAQLSPEERKAETIFAGVTPTGWDLNGGVTQFESGGVGTTCRYEETDATTPEKELSTFDEYFTTLDTSCANDQWLLDQGGIIEFTPDQWTPDTIYYQCVTHANLGFKVSIIDEWDPAATSSPTAVPVTPSPTAATEAPVVNVNNNGGNVENIEELAANGFELLELPGQLEGSTLFFKFNLADPNANGQDTISVVFEAPVLAWTAVGFSDNGGFMPGSEAVIGLPDTGEVLKYNLNARSGDGVVPMPTEQQTLIDTSIEQNEDGATVLSFTKILNEPGEIVINLEDENTFLSAWGNNNNLGIHAARGSYTLEGGELETRKQNLWIVHGWLAAFAWAFLCPLAIVSSVFRQFFCIDGLWFQLHRALNLLVVTFTFAAFIVAVVAINQETPDGAEAGHFKKNETSGGHKTIGLVIFILAFLQGLGGILRPHAPETPKERTTKRLGFEIGHRVVGLGLLGLCWYQVQLGIQAYGDIFAGGDVDSLLVAIYAIIGSFSVILAIGYAIKIVTEVRSPKQKDTPTVPSSINSSNTQAHAAQRDETSLEEPQDPVEKHFPSFEKHSEREEATPAPLIPPSSSSSGKKKSSNKKKRGKSRSKSPKRDAPEGSSRSPNRKDVAAGMDYDGREEPTQESIVSPPPTDAAVKVSRQASLGLDGFRDSRMTSMVPDP